MQSILKKYAIVGLFIGIIAPASAQYSPDSDTLDISKETLVVNHTETGDQSVRTSAFTVEKKADITAATSLMTLHPRAIPFVKDYLELHEGRLVKMKSTAIPYFKMIDRIFAEKDLPTELKYLAVIESDLSSSAVSWAGAVGPWQFMPETGKLMGLKVGKYLDERRDLYKSSYAAAKYLKGLYAQLNDWLLVIAAYNGGPARVESAIRKSGSRNFWDLQYFLPAESRTHVKKFIATHYIMEGQGGITTTGANDAIRLGLLPPSKEMLDNTLLQTLTGRYNSGILAKTIDMDPVVFNQLNPAFDQKVGSETYGMRLPEDKMKLFNEKKMEILEASVSHLLNGSAAQSDIIYPKEIRIPEKKTSKKK
jgi:membrane-bound lytic murein transglycosylase D